jgi:VanZ family protein
MLAAYIMLLIIGAVITLPSGGLPANDKILHFLEFMVLAIIIVKTFEVYGAKNHYILTFLFSCLVAILSEAAQLSTLSRSFSILDLAANTAGIIVGMIFYRIVLSRFIRH